MTVLSCGRSEKHWLIENYKQRMTTKQWRKLLLEYNDKVIFRGRLRQLKAKSLGAGVVEVYKEPLKESER